MKKFIVSFVLLVIAGYACAQSGPHEYLTIRLMPRKIVGALEVIMTDVEQRSLDRRSMDGKRPIPGTDLKAALTLVQEYEALGYTLYAFSTHSAGEAAQEETWVWLMRKPKQ